MNQREFREYCLCLAKSLQTLTSEETKVALMILSVAHSAKKKIGESMNFNIPCMAEGVGLSPEDAFVAVCGLGEAFECPLIKLFRTAYPSDITLRINRDRDLSSRRADWPERERKLREKMTERNPPDRQSRRALDLRRESD